VADPYVYPGSTVLRNLPGLRDAGALAEREAQASTLRLAQLAASGLEVAYDLPHLQRFHRFTFQDIYPWAGELRSIRLAKPGSMFALPEHIASYAAEVLHQLVDEQHLRGLPRERFAERLAHYYAEVNAVHPFREGNGRAQRAFLRQLADRESSRPAQSLTPSFGEAQAVAGLGPVPPVAVTRACVNRRA
jgi:cell filamentation protein